MTGVAHETNCSQRCGKRTLGGEKGFCVCVGGGGGGELEVDERRVTGKEQGKNQVPTVSSPSLPAITNREIST